MEDAKAVEKAKRVQIDNRRSNNMKDTPEVDRSKEKKTYTINTCCRNCNDDITIRIPFGTRVHDHEVQDICPRCGCRP